MHQIWKEKSKSSSGTVLDLFYRFDRGTKYTCNCSWKRTNMPAITVSLGTKYAYNVSKDGGHINMQFRIERVSNTPAMTTVFQMVFRPNAITLKMISKIESLQAYLFPFLPRLHTYFPINIKISSIYGPQWNCYCRHI